MTKWALVVVACLGAWPSWQLVVSGLTGVNVSTTITAPTSSATYDAGTSDTLTTLAGTAISDRPIASCTWTNSLGGSGAALGTTSWSVPSIALTVGSNVITVTCLNNAGGSGAAVLTVTRASGVCDSTISSGSNLNTSISGMTAGQTLCLNAGTYATGMSLTGWTKSPSVTVKPVTTSTAVTLTGLAFNGSVSGVTFDAHQGGAGTWFTANNISFNSSGTKTNLIVRGVNASSTTGQFLSVNGVVGDTSAVEYFTVNNVLCSFAGGTDQRIIFDANGTAGSQKLALRFGTIDGGGSDGIRFDGTAGGTVEDTLLTNVVEDPGFEADCHSDAMQVYGGQNMIVRDNYFLDNVVGWAAYDGSVDVTITNNIFDNGSHGRDSPLEIYSVTGGTIAHNTLLHDTSCGSDGCAEIVVTYKAVDDPSSGLTIRDNIATAISHGDRGDASQYTATYNLLRSGATGTNISGAPTYTGGTSPTTVGGFLLSGGSLGEDAASDATDIGVNTTAVLALAMSQARWRLAKAFGWREPPVPHVSPHLAAWKARVARKQGRLDEARWWLRVARENL